MAVLRAPHPSRFRVARLELPPERSGGLGAPRISPVDILGTASDDDRRNLHGAMLEVRSVIGGMTADVGRTCPI